MTATIAPPLPKPARTAQCGQENVRFVENERQSYGVVSGDGIVDAGARVGEKYADMAATPGKNFDCCGAFGPWMVTKDEIDDAQSLTILHRVNGAEIQNGSTADMIFPIARIIAYISTFTGLEPGDTITTGSPGGIRPRREQGIYLKPNDKIEMEIPGIGVLANPVVDEA